MDKKPTLNREWHLRNRMPHNPTVDQRIAWHLEHEKHCKCRPIPEKLRETMRQTGNVGNLDTDPDKAGG